MENNVAVYTGKDGVKGLINGVSYELEDVKRSNCRVCVRAIGTFRDKRGLKESKIICPYDSYVVFFSEWKFKG